MSQPKSWYIRNNEEHLGPYSLQELKMIGLYNDDYVWREGLPGWTKADSISELNNAIVPVNDPFHTHVENFKKASLPTRRSSPFNTILSNARKTIRAILKKATS